MPFVILDMVNVPLRELVVRRVFYLDSRNTPLAVLKTLLLLHPIQTGGIKRTFSRIELSRPISFAELSLLDTRAFS